MSTSQRIHSMDNHLPPKGVELPCQKRDVEAWQACHTWGVEESNVWTQKQASKQIGHCRYTNLNQQEQKQSLLVLYFNVIIYNAYHIIIPIPSMCGIFTYIWLICMVKVGKYTIHAWIVWDYIIHQFHALSRRWSRRHLMQGWFWWCHTSHTRQSQDW